MLGGVMAQPSIDPPPAPDADSVKSIFRESLPTAVSCVAVGFVVMAVSYVMRFGWSVALLPAAVASVCALTAAAMRVWLMRRQVPWPWVHPFAQSLVLLVLVCLCTTLAVTRLDIESLHFGLLIIGSGLFFLTWPCLTVAIALVLTGWLATVWLARVPMQWDLYPHTLAGSAILAVLAMTVRRTAVNRLIVAMQTAQQQQGDTEKLALQLSRSERAYRDLFNGMLNGFGLYELVYDAAGRPVDARIVEANDRFIEYIQRPRELVVGKRITQLLHDPDPIWMERFTRVVATGRAEHFESFSRLMNRVLEVVAYPVDVHRIAVILTDVTERRRQEEALRQSESHYRMAAESNRRLLSEVNHRVRNNLAGLIGLLTLVRRQAKDVSQYHAAIEQRIAAMTHVHNVLAEANWANLSLRELIAKLLVSMQRSAPRQIPVQIKGPEVSLVPRQIAPLTMTLVELFTNSCKYGAHCSETGSISITWRTQREDGRLRVTINWRERGGPPITAVPTTSLGTELIEGFVAFELGGRATLRYEPEGVDHLIEFTAAVVEPDDAVAPQPG
jgi:two-component sensor histidine kinase/uncharacterized membrane protein (UPF0136 family)